MGLKKDLQGNVSVILTKDGKSDPHVRVIGLPEAVNEASQRVRFELQPHNKITMKMDVSWTCHSHIIGKGGNTIQPVVKRTGVSIHFPDGNKNSEVNKSNQVSVNSRGQEITGLEEARRAIRELTPLIFTFTLPASAEFIGIYDSSLLVSHVQCMYNVQAEIQLFNEDTLIGSVKGTEWDAARVKEATFCLLKALCGNLANQMTVQVTLEVSPQHHSFVLGRNNEVVRKIMQRTTTKIDFPDVNDPILHPLSRSTIKISGAIDNVYLARQNIIGCLPLVLMFDILPETTIEQMELNQIMQTLDVIIIAKGKRMDGRRSTIIKGAERNASNIYEAWRMVSKQLKSVPKAKIPPTYHLLEFGSLYGVEPYMLNSVLCDAFSGLYIDTPIQNLSPRVPYTSNPFKLPATENGTNSPPKTRCSSKTDFSDACPLRQHSLVNGKSTDDVEKPFKDVEELFALLPDRRAPGCEKKQGAVSDYYCKKLLANEVMKQPVLPQPRIPTSSWSGYGFSKSQPDNQIKREPEMNLDDAWREWTKGSSGTSSTVSDSSSSAEPQKTFKVTEGRYADKPKNNYVKSSSNYLDALFPSLRPCWSTYKFNDLDSILVLLQMEQYKDFFDSQDVDLDAFCTLNDQDLKDMGVTIFAHRKKLLLAIKELGLKRQTTPQLLIT